MDNSMFKKKTHMILCGKRLWKKYSKKYKINYETAFILMPSQDKLVNVYGSVYLNNFLKAHGLKEAIVLTADESTEKTVCMIAINVREVINISRDKMDCLVAYYCACNPDRRFIVVDIDTISARKPIRNLIGVSNITLEKIIAMGIYHLVPFVKVDVPLYGLDK